MIILLASLLLVGLYVFSGATKVSMLELGKDRMRHESHSYFFIQTTSYEPIGFAPARSGEARSLYYQGISYGWYGRSCGLGNGLDILMLMRQGIRHNWSMAYREKFIDALLAEPNSSALGTVVERWRRDAVIFECEHGRPP